ncbi:MAG: precorrin-3B C(17)-methyltransferase [Cenarchaeum sp. SB0661_bin_35]|nr:precorrin-3B C(17)-methyltransferase [Cenarchaeum sp. SB0667_bin_13]MXZ92960.1 precorrin-3B C(17)-methyltransferase [Cenarchaeum sp. SB0666_bin_15]MYB46582.1 precorrin-3B C(17)-methyltransferase [Cenarchaeum sp. SB0662_bin_33]MYC79052.1 precorrin-3B C(17)-methyltransferase [Cenarchaeum sp. SB0661_bin_35]MYD59340.1 precorrin-3B C(17)-methyltransferase [Cenarchaeum sp. SB0678_bin_8]MYI51869.1 precorrin-3B C(17)-methyltransferase [Cenarchaeum sp. SB0673_bin_9]MYJ27441.1 precorrin-3B C(17)-met
MMKVAVLAITKNGKKIGQRLTEAFPNMTLYSPKKLQGPESGIMWYDESTTQMAGELFTKYDGIVYLFSLGAVIRLIAPHLRDKKSDPAVIVIDDRLCFVISVLSGHLGGANALARKIAERMGATPVITTAADVNKTIAVDLVGRDLGWVIDDDVNVTRISAYMINQEPIGVFQDAGSKEWWPRPLPSNVTIYDTLESLTQSNSKGYLIITDRIMPDDIADKSVIYRPPSLVVGVGLHYNTTADTIQKGISQSLKKYNLCIKCIAKIASIEKPRPIQGIQDASDMLNVPLQLVDRGDLARIPIPNPSGVVEEFEGTPSVSEAAAILVSNGNLIVEKQKFPPDLTVAVARIL